MSCRSPSTSWSQTACPFRNGCSPLPIPAAMTAAIPSISAPIFFFNDTATTEIYTLSLHDALPIYQLVAFIQRHRDDAARHGVVELGQLTLLDHTMLGGHHDELIGHEFAH